MEARGAEMPRAPEKLEPLRERRWTPWGPEMVQIRGEDARSEAVRYAEENISEMIEALSTPRIWTPIPMSMMAQNNIVWNTPFGTVHAIRSRHPSAVEGWVFKDYER